MPRVVLTLCLLAFPLWAGGVPAQSVPLASLIEQLRNTGVTVIYSTDVVRPHMRSQTTHTGTPLQALRAALGEHGLTLSLVDASVSDTSAVYLILQATQHTPTKVAPGNLIGQVREQRTGVPVRGADIEALPHGVTSTTDADGRFQLLGLPPGQYTVRVRHGGLQIDTQQRATVRSVRTSRVDFQVRPAPRALQNLVVASGRYRLAYIAPDSHSFFSSEDLLRWPDPGADPLRARQRLPGVAAGGVSARAHVRGGEEDETLVVLDGVALYDPFHLRDFQGLFSTIDALTVGSMDAYNGTFPAQYGDRLSSVMDIVPRQADEARYTRVGLDLFNLGLLSQGLFNNQRSEWLISARRGTLDWVLDAANADVGAPRMADALLRLHHRFNANTRVSTSLLLSNDEIAADNASLNETASASYDDSQVWIRADHRFSPAWSASAWLSGAHLDSRRRGRSGDDEGGGVANVVDERNFSGTRLKAQVEFSPNQRYLARAGIEAATQNADYRYHANGTINDPLGLLRPADRVLGQDTQIALEGERYTIYTTHRIQLHPRWTGEFGLRWDRQTAGTFADTQTSPRASLLFRAGPNTDLRLGWGLYHQAQQLNELQVEDGITHFFDARRASHSTLGLTHRIADTISLRVEMYNKNLQQVRPRFANLFDSLVLLPELRADRVKISPDSARARGLEILLRGSADASLHWSVTYALASIKDRIGAQRISREWEQRHSFGFALGTQWRRWQLSLSGTHHSGWPITTLALGEDGQTVQTGPRNGATLKDYTAIDAGANATSSLNEGGCCCPLRPRTYSLSAIRAVWRTPLSRAC